MRRLPRACATGLLLVACRDAPPRAAASAIPRTPADIAGVVTAADTAWVRIEVDPMRETGAPKALLRLRPYTVILRAAGDSAAPAPRGTLRAGARVRAWYGGPVLESYPVQGDAGTVVIDALPSATPVRPGPVIVHPGAQVRVRAPAAGPGWLVGTLTRSQGPTPCLGVRLARTDAQGRTRIVTLRGVDTLEVDSRSNQATPVFGLDTPRAGGWRPVPLAALRAQDAACRR
jgi:hypothetical protein